MKAYTAFIRPAPVTVLDPVSFDGFTAIKPYIKNMLFIYFYQPVNFT